VRNLRGDDYQVTAEVRGTAEYDVVIRREHSELIVRCDCPYFVDRQEPCKHCWAVLLAAEKARYLNGNGSFRGLSIEVEDLDDVEDDAD